MVESLLPELCAYDIIWDTENSGELEKLPKIVSIPADLLLYADALSDYVSDQTGFCHSGFKVGLMFRGTVVPCTFDRGSSECELTFSVENNCGRYDITIRMSGHLTVFIDWGFGRVELARLANAARYLTINELAVIINLCNEILNAERTAVAKIITINSMFVSPQTADLLDKEIVMQNDKSVCLPPVYEAGHGWFIYCGECDLKCPEDLRNVIQYAKDRGCTWLCLDANGPVVPNLVSYTRAN